MNSSETALKGIDQLNPDQHRAVTQDEGAVLVVAGAGSGKTRTLAYRVAYLIEKGVAPERILLLTFTRRAAREMLSRARAAASTDARTIARVWGGTFHATANRLLRIYAKTAGLSPDFTIMDQSDSQDLINVIRHEMSLSTKEARFPRKSTCLAVYSRRVNGGEPLDAVLKRYFPWCERWKDELTELFKRYVDRKQAHSVLDYDDLLLYWQWLLEQDKVAESMCGRFDHILVDEYQDTNRVQAAILRGMRRSNPTIMAVGDDAQSIYGFRSATVRNMLDFPTMFPGCRVVTLEQNYRSVTPILTTTNRVIEQARGRYSKELWSTRGEGSRPQLVTCGDEDEQDDMVVRTILRHYEEGVPLRKQAVLFRAAWHSNSLELALAQRNIPYRKYGGLRFLEAAHIKDLVAFLKIAENPRDKIAWFRVLELLSGVGPVTAASAFAHLEQHAFDPSSLDSFAAPSSARDELAGLARLQEDLLRAGRESPSLQIERIHRFYRPVLKRTYENPEARDNDIVHLAELARKYRSRKSFLTEIVLDPPVSTGDLAGAPSRDEDWLVLSTIHSAKGGEWDAVYVIHAADGCLPSDMSTGSEEEIEEELRLTYVAMTRARDFLYVLWPMRYYHRKGGMSDSHSYAQCSRFFTPRVVETMEQTVLCEAETTDPAEETSEPDSATQTLRDRLKSFWD